MLPERAMLQASLLARSAGLMLAIGSSLEVWPVAGLPEETLARGRQAGDRDDGRDALRRATPTVKLSGDVVSELEAVVAVL